ncbi:MAG: hypothetical protein ABJC09_14340 [Terriglobia bacterium]
MRKIVSLARSAQTAGKIDRRGFLQTAGTLTALGGRAAAALPSVSLLVEPGDAIANAAPAKWAAAELARALTAAGSPVRMCAKLSEVQPGSQCIVVAGARSTLARDLLRRAGVSVPQQAESLAIVPGSTALAAGYDTRGLVYALLNVADRVRQGAALLPEQAVAEKPNNRIRSWTRLFTSDVEDKPWYNDREMWPEYLTMLATNRFNRFNLALGIGYDFIRQVTDAYFLFSYPFLIDVPGYKVRAPQLPDKERDANLAMLKFISEQTVARGMEFQLGLWMHGYEWIDTKNANYTIEGLNKENHGPYCRDAVRQLLRACPAISGITFRVHGESGVEEGSYDFWKTVFDGVATCGRKVEIDMHAKGMDEEMQKIAVATKQPVKISPKYWAEHFGMPYHQADIRAEEQPKPGRGGTGLMKNSAGARSFLRYGYGDLLREDRPFGIVHRIWPGTQRLLLWADPVTAAGHSRAFTFCGSDGVEVMEPLSFKGRRGSGIAGDRCAYLDASLKPRWDWQKYEYGTRVWGRMLYNPETPPSEVRPFLNKQFGPAALAVESALANASRILPIITTGHATSAGNNTYWPELYLNQSLIDGDHPGPYRDTPVPRVFGNVSPLDPQLFSRINDFADQLLSGEVSGKYSPVEVAQWIEDYSAKAAENLAQAEKLATGKARPEYRRMAIDVAIQSRIGTFFGSRFRSAVLYRIYEKTGDRRAFDESLRKYREARAAWAEIVAIAKPVYKPDITIGENPQLRGHWSDRLPAIDADIALLAKQADSPRKSERDASAAIQAALGRPSRSPLTCNHTAAATFRAGQPLPVELTVANTATARLFYRHVTHAERYQSTDMELKDGRYRATIAGDYTNSPYPLEYYFELKRGNSAWLYPGFKPELANQPYFVVRKAQAVKKA